MEKPEIEIPTTKRSVWNAGKTGKAVELRQTRCPEWGRRSPVWSRL